MLLRGLLLGLAIAAPVGPIGVLCIRQTLTFGWLKGFISGLGAATADGMYGCIAGFSSIAFLKLNFNNGNNRVIKIFIITGTTNLYPYTMNF